MNARYGQPPNRCMYNRAIRPPIRCKLSRLLTICPSHHSFDRDFAAGLNVPCCPSTACVCGISSHPAGPVAAAFHHQKTKHNHCASASPTGVHQHPERMNDDILNGSYLQELQHRLVGPRTAERFARLYPAQMPWKRDEWRAILNCVPWTFKLKKCLLHAEQSEATAGLQQQRISRKLDHRLLG